VLGRPADAEQVGGVRQFEQAEHLSGRALEPECHADNGMAFGALCAMDREPRRFRSDEVREVAGLARLVTDSLELRTR
jgi:hypothetical protein